MYLPPQFESEDPAHALALMRAHPFASLISNDEEGFPFVTHLPLHVDERGHGDLVLLGHCARANPHWRYLQARPEALVTFQGPHAYMSPSVYPDLARVPTWNYLAVHCRVRARLIDGAQDKDALLKALIADHEPAYAAQWRAQDEDFARKMLAGIVAFELRVQDLQCKLKLNQHRKEAHAAMYACYSSGTPDECALARWMQRLGIAVDAKSAKDA
ncbi:MAG: FMN-binding negative transcriptional regulator [Proteobacteria bacterium]|nr:FMN-binding negative transcriptional regulator [Pseudomonadota bacterium]